MCRRLAVDTGKSGSLSHLSPVNSKDPGAATPGDLRHGALDEEEQQPEMKKTCVKAREGTSE